jgi:ornithine lipid ester-linked acyl 2-hydroxylase
VLLYSEAFPDYQDISGRQTNITNDNRWKTFFFYAFGFQSGPNCDRCPKTWTLLKDIPGLQVAFFSILAPNKHIPEHTGKYKGVIRYHLALKVPEPADNCGIWSITDSYIGRKQKASLAMIPFLTKPGIRLMMIMSFYFWISCVP